MMDPLYSEMLLDLYHHPLNKILLDDFDFRYQETNPLCGDEIEIFIKFDQNDRVSAIGWQGEGCAISQAATSLVTNFIKNKTKNEIKEVTKEDILQMLGLENLNPTRLRCALLGLKAIQKSYAPLS